MPINFESTPFFDAVIYSGRDVNYKDQLDKTLAKPAREQALEELKASYEHHKTKVNFKYSRFLEIVEKNLSKLNEPGIDPQVRLAVATKLTDLAKKRITVKESHYSLVHKLAHKIWQFIQGRGFQTKAEWGMKLADEMKRRDLESYSADKTERREESYSADKTERRDLESYASELERCISHGLGLKLGETPPKKIIEDMKDTTNSLSEESFRHILKDIVFKIKGSDFFAGETNKYTFYKNLNEDKRRIFHEELMSNASWYEQASDIIKGPGPDPSNEKVKAFVSWKMVSNFQSNPQDVVRRYHEQKPPIEKFFYVMVEKALSDYLNRNAFEDITKLLQNTRDGIKWENILASPKLLTTEEIQKLKGNIDFNA